MAATIAGTVFLISAALIPFGFGSSDIRIFVSYFALGMLALILQLTTFPASSCESITNQTRFWLIQLAGAASRLVAVVVLVWFLSQSFIGILFANVSGAVTVALCFRRPLLGPRTFVTHLMRAIRYVGKLVTLDGFLRAARVYYEQLLISVSLIGTDALHVLDPDTVKYMYASSGYLNAGASAARQLFPSQELKAFQRRLRPAQRAIISALFLAGSLMIWQANRWTQWHAMILPAIPPPGQSLILASIAIAAALHPLTLGFAFLEFLPAQRLRKAAIALAALPIPVYVLAGAAVLGLHLAGYPFWAAVTPLTIGISRRFW
ncbi:MAG: hypothetical protein J2P49_01450 [Methylocapsa sp.]|nr:hypothetical protein [Methylocapsa sp.]